MSGSVHLVGIGPGGEDAISVGALGAIERARELWMLELGPRHHERAFLRERFVGKHVVNVYGYYLIPGCPRDAFYQLLARRIAYLAGRGRSITMLVSGNPAYWVRLAQVLKRLVETRALTLETTYSMSFLDVIYGPTPFTCTGGLQLRMSTVTDPDISPELDCIIGQVGDVRTSELLAARAQRAFCRSLRRFYAADHPVYVVGNHSVDDTALYLATTVASLADKLADLGAYHFSLLVPSRTHVREHREHAVAERHHARLGYLRSGTRL